MIQSEVIRVLLIEDDEDDYVIVRDLFSEVRGERFELEWARDYQSGLEAALRNQHDVCLVDYRLGAHTGLELLKVAVARNCAAPLILLTGLGQREIDLAAMEAGAADYLIKGQLRADALGRSIRYALERKRLAAAAAFEQGRLAAFGAEIGLALARRDKLDALMERCARALVQYLGATLAQVAVFNPEKQTFERHACASDLAGAPQATEMPPLAPLDPATLATGQPALLKNLAGEKWWSAAAPWASLVSYAGYPLVLDDKLVGIMSVFTAQPITDKILQEMGSVANGLALGIERKLSEEALDRSERTYQAVVESIKEVIFQVDEFGTWVLLNPAWTAMSGYEVAATLGTLFLDYLDEEDRPHNREVFQRILKQELEQCRHEARFLTKKGESRCVEVFVQARADETGRVLGLSGTLTDITERKNAESQLRHAQKLESVGRLAAGIAHDFNNILTVIQGYTECLQNRFKGDSTAAAPLEQVAAAAKRAAALTRQLLTFSRKQVIQPSLLDLNTVLQNLVKMLGRVVGEDIVVETEYGAELPGVEGDVGMLEQVVMNLVVNARDAISGGGRLRLATHRVELDANYARTQPEAVPGVYACVSVTDTGCGMDTQTLERIFEPFFTTKGIGKGTGLGLATVYGIVKQHKGWVEVLSAPGQGSTFKVFLPAAGKATAPVAQPAAIAPAQGGRETILVAEDDSVLREMVVEMLGNTGYRVVEAGSGLEALEVWERQAGAVDLLLTDMVMPEGLSGRELGQRLKARRPELRIIYSSGYGPEAWGGDSEPGDGWFLPKPYEPAQLAQLVRQCLDGGDPSANALCVTSAAGRAEVSGDS